MVKNKDIFSIRKFKTGTHSALIGKLGVVAATALAVGLSGATASADEVTTVSTTPVVEVVNPNPATNLETVQEAPSAESLATQAEAGQKTGELTSPVTSTELDLIVTDAKEAGVTVTEENKPVAYENLDQAQADLTKQTDVVKEATDKQEANTTAIKEATDKNAEIDRQNKAEAERVAEYNKTGQEAVDARNKAGQEAVDARNANALAEWEANKETIIAADAAAMAGYNERKKANEEANAKGQAEADAKNAELKAEYDKALKEYNDLLAENDEIQKRNDAAAAAAKAENDRLKAEYQAKLDEIKSKIGTEGNLSELTYQSLEFNSEPNAHYEASGVINKNDYGFVLQDGESLILTYTGIENSTYNNTKIGKVVYTYTAKGDTVNLSPLQDPTVTINFVGMNGLTSAGETRLGFKAEYYDETGKLIEFTNDAPALISLSSLNRNSPYSGTGTGEGVELTSSNTTFIPIVGSTIAKDGNKIYSSIIDNSNSDRGARFDGTKGGVVINDPNNYWDTLDGPLRWYGAGVLKVDSGTNISFDIVNNWANSEQGNTGAYYFGFNTRVAAPVLPPLPVLRKVTPEELKPVPATPPTLETVNFTPTPFDEEPPTPTKIPNKPVTETFTPEVYTPITPVVIPYVSVPEKKVFEASIHPVLVKQTPANSKDIINEDGVSVDGKLVPKGATEKWTLTNANLKAGRQEVTAYVMNDPFPAGFEIDRAATAAENTAWTVSYDENGKAKLTATDATLNLFNANRNQDVVVPVAYFVGRPINDGGTYKNTFTTVITTPTGEYKVVSNTPVIYTPGSEDPRNPGGENPTPYDNLIEPKKDVVDENGNSIDGQSILPNTTLNYVAEQDLDQYKGIVASQNAIGKGFFYVDDYLDAAIDGSSLVVNSIKAANGDDVRAMLDMIHVLSADTLDEKLQALIKESGISPVGEFYLWVAKDPQAFFKAYVEQGLDIAYNLSFKVKQDFVGTVTNQTYQIDFGNGYYGNIVTNELPQLVVHKDVLDKDGKSIDGGTVKIGDLVTYKLEGWVIPAGRAYDIKEYRFVDILQATHDEYQTYEIKAEIDFTLADGTVIKAGDDLKRYTETVYNVETGKLETRFREDFLNQIPRTSAFGADGYITVKRIAAGEVVNEYTLYVNGNPVVSNKVITETPEPPKPETPTPTPQTLAPVPAGPSLPNTGTNASQALSIAGIGGLMLSVLAQFGLVKRKAKED
ncbi:YSIRK signal domain/LPXTG anchor domain surface protein [Streptococcus suis]|uniref:YSIRK signal domain/LPXTG anchor domain surface protein n=1 Tax=Streptococcus suis TaxID=1307 RepID=UPI0005CC911A|nr:YSIRK signal domain/LPXTG anchor domain surface protein [Streptococcus suis]NQH64069.1 YSIRK signal domain/LPXTG anchor domain surface protein [Streptococcus suis]CYU83368.1 putative cell surface protein [Streptococcus suis]